jgi:hypothetical protein
VSRTETTTAPTTSATGSISATTTAHGRATGRAAVRAEGGVEGDRRGRRRMALAVLGLGAVLALVGCGAPGGAARTGTTADPASTSTEGDSAEASGEPADPRTGDTGEGPTTTFTMESGLFGWTVPEEWSGSQQAYNEELLDYLGVPYEEASFQDPERTVEFLATTGVGPTDGDGPKPEVVAVLEVREMPEVPEAPVHTGKNAMRPGPVWFRAALVRASGAVQDESSVEGGEFLLSLQVVTAPAQVDPEATDESFWSAWFYEVPAAPGHDLGSAAFLTGTVTQESAEQVTGLAGEEAMRAVVHTDRYAELRGVMTSMEVRLP